MEKLSKFERVMKNELRDVKYGTTTIEKSMQVISDAHWDEVESQIEAESECNV